MGPGPGGRRWSAQSGSVGKRQPWLGEQPLLVPRYDAFLSWPAPALLELPLSCPLMWPLHSKTAVTSTFLSMSFQMPVTEECSILKCVT